MKISPQFHWKLGLKFFTRWKLTSFSRPCVIWSVTIEFSQVFYIFCRVKKRQNLKWIKLAITIFRFKREVVFSWCNSVQNIIKTKQLKVCKKIFGRLSSHWNPKIRYRKQQNRYQFNIKMQYQKLQNRGLGLRQSKTESWFWILSSLLLESGSAMMQ